MTIRNNLKWLFETIHNNLKQCKAIDNHLRPLMIIIEGHWTGDWGHWRPFETMSDSWRPLMTSWCYWSSMRPLMTIRCHRWPSEAIDNPWMPLMTMGSHLKTLMIIWRHWWPIGEVTWACRHIQRDFGIVAFSEPLPTEPVGSVGTRCYSFMEHDEEFAYKLRSFELGQNTPKKLWSSVAFFLELQA